MCVSLLFCSLNVNLTLTFPPVTLLRRQVKQIAGNIIPAIATTNAIVAGGQVMEAIKIIRGLDIRKHCKYTYVLTGFHRTHKSAFHPVASTVYTRGRSAQPQPPLDMTMTSYLS
jgi:hypothetical protein